ncbi:MAG TPA: glycogen/starch/alpha-glucan phosphorylase, partial [Candidatus Caccosoma faecigallinarum]|nr:glycogen/starch/alpha-glucan phosphorylase [Candidatus Caccosoma faecigallinarum]
PNKFNNKTNGVTHRRWLAYANPELSAFLNKHLDHPFIEDPAVLESLLKHIDRPEVLDEFLQVKQKRKEILAKFIKEKNNVEIDPYSIFDTQIKRLHAYKRQLLNCLHIIYLYQNLLEHPESPIYPRTFIFGAKAAPSYYFAKKVIELINCMAEKINYDPRVNKYLKVIFLENYDVSSAEIIIPGSDVSEQISLAGKEASGTGNMKFMMNGAITLGTLDGANVEISQLVGEDNCVLFGLKSFEVDEFKASNTYNAFKTYMENKEIKAAVDSLINGTWHVKLDEFKAIYDELLYKNDEYLLLIDFADYIRAQKEIERLYQDRHRWAKMCLINIAKSGYFSSDRTIQEYADDIWKISKV